MPDYSIVTDYFRGPRGDDLEQVLKNNPEKTQEAIHAFGQMIGFLTEQFEVSFVCFLDAENQPSGTLRIMKNIHDLTNVQTSVWSRKSKTIISGYKPKRDERAVIIYDICSSGQTLYEVARNLHSRYGVDPRAAVVYMNKNHIEKLNITDEGIAVPVLDVLSFPGTKRNWSTSNQVGPQERKERMCSLPPTSPDSLVSTKGIEPVKEGTMTPEKTRTFQLATLVATPVAVYFVLCLLATIGIIPKQVVNNIREYVTILAR